MSSDAAFYGDGSKVIAATVDVTENPRSILSAFDIDDYYELVRSVEWLKHSSNISRVGIYGNCNG